MKAYKVWLVVLLTIYIRERSGLGLEYGTQKVSNLISSKFYVSLDSNDEAMTLYARGGGDTDERDQIKSVTRVDGISILLGGLKSLFRDDNQFQRTEVAVPVVDDEDTFKGGYRLLGFVKLIPLINNGDSYEIEYIRRYSNNKDSSHVVSDCGESFNVST